MVETYEEAFDKIQQIVQNLEDSDMPLEQSLDRYAEGLRLLGVCYEKLNAAEKRFEQLSETLDSLEINSAESD